MYADKPRYLLQAASWKKKMEDLGETSIFLGGGMHISFTTQMEDHFPFWKRKEKLNKGLFRPIMNPEETGGGFRFLDYQAWKGKRTWGLHPIGASNWG